MILLCLPLFIRAQQPNPHSAQPPQPDKIDEKHFKIYDVQAHKIISLDQLLLQISKNQVIFFGEEHNDSVAHYLELEIYKGLLSKNPQTALSMEMFATDVQLIIDEYLSSLISEKNFIKEARVWNNYKDYRPVLEYAKMTKQQIIAGNVSSRYSNAVSKQGLNVLKNFPKPSLKFLPPLPVDTANGAYYQKFLDVMGGQHMGMMKIYQTQNLWDASMAWAIAGFLKDHKKATVLQLNGRFHSDEKLGTYAKLKRYSPKVTSTNISCFYSDDFQQPDWQKHQHLADYIILTDPEVKRSY